MYLVINVESTDRPQPHLSVEHPAQPHLIGFTGIVFDEGGIEVEQLSTLVRPRPDAALPLRAYQTHGISLELATREGRDSVEVLRWFSQQVDEANCLVGHDLSYSIDIIRILSARITGEVWEPSCATFCTMAHSSPKINEPIRGGLAMPISLNQGWPSLSHCMEQFFGYPIGETVGPLSKACACNEIYRHLTQKNEAA